MRSGSILLPMVAVCAACSMPGAGNRADASDEEPVPTIGVSATGPGNCGAAWNGEAVSDEAVRQRTFVLLERVVREQGGLANMRMEALPTVRVEAATDLPWSCVGRILGQVQLAGLPRVALSLAGSGAGAEQRAHFFLIGVNASPPVTIVRVAGDGRATWNNEPVDLDGVRERTRGSAASVPGMLLIAPAEGTNFGTVHDVVRAVLQGQGEPTLPGCRGSGERPADAPEPSEAESATC